VFFAAAGVPGGSPWDDRISSCPQNPAAAASTSNSPTAEVEYRFVERNMVRYSP
jgi:hypothetical protein